MVLSGLFPTHVVSYKNKSCQPEIPKSSLEFDRPQQQTIPIFYQKWVVSSNALGGHHL